MTGAVHIEIETRQLKLKEPFVIAGASADEKPMALVRLRQETSGGGVLEGLGEASLSIKSAESFEKNLDFLHNLPEDLFDDPTRIKDIADRLDRLERGCRPAKCAVDLALYDLNGKMLERPVYNLFDLEKHGVPHSFVTLCLGDEAQTLARAAELRGQDYLKVKVDSAFDLRLLEEIQSISGAKLAIDANESWQYDEAVEKLNHLAERVDLEFCEQPLPASKVQDQRKLKQAVPVPIYLDEAIITRQDVELLAESCDGINVKLMKCGGIYRAIELITRARARNLKVLIGCMVESSIGITGASHIAHLADYLDLDGSSFLAWDPFVGTFLHRGRVILPTGTGLGVIEKKHVQ
ncbi:MAG: hypothetical protein A2284_14410 [Deltaproteobacteria bacterium RIFOXYA12_FULL_61_11]|nr:MAG: hypothetical protein A2284_14410 [Deltaproteobacteria bacterium RIFOXYA12_FULL_61_11]